MRKTARLLTLALLAVISNLPTAFAQQPGAVNVRPRVTTSAPSLPIVNVNVDRQRVPLGDLVTFTLSPASIVLNPQYIVTLYFGDGGKTQDRKTTIVHFYRFAGNYRYSVSVSGRDQVKSKVPQVKLSATPLSATIGQTVSFRAELSENYRGIKYRFVFGDGRQTAWQESSQTTHEYVSSITYLAYVDIGTAGAGTSIERIGGSRLAIHILPTAAPLRAVTLTAKPSRIEQRQLVLFTAGHTGNATDPRYRFVFGDKSPPTGWQTSSVTEHRYLAAGAYSAHVEVRVLNDPSAPQVVSSAPAQIKVKAATKQAVSLDANPTSVIENLPVFFRARVEPSGSNIRYRFNFGDGSTTTAWMGKAFETHAYLRAGNYAPYVEIGRATSGPINAIASSSRQVTVTALWPPDAVTSTPTPTPGLSPSNGTPTPTVDKSSSSPGPLIPNIGGTTPSPGEPTPVQEPGGFPPNDWWIYLLIALLLLAGYQTWRWFAAPRPTFQPHLDPGVSQVGTEKPLSIDFQVQLNPDIAAGEYGIKSNEGSFIKSERTSDD
jgi:PKD repeat protein